STVAGFDRDRYALAQRAQPALVGDAAALRDHRVAQRVAHLVERERARRLALADEHEVHAVRRRYRTRPRAHGRGEHPVGELRSEATRQLVARLERLLGAVQERIAELQCALARRRLRAQPRERAARLALAVGAEVELGTPHAFRAAVARGI